MSFKYTTAVKYMQMPNIPKQVLRELADFADDNGKAFPSIPTIAAALCVTERSVSNGLAYLREHKIITQISGKGGNNIYQIHPENFKGEYKYPANFKASPLNDVHSCTTFTPEPHSGNPCTTFRSPLNDVLPNNHITINNHQSSSNTREEKISQPPAQFVQYHNFDLEKISVIELGQKYSTLKFDFIELSKPRHPELDQHDLENMFDEFGDWFASPNDFGKQSFKTAQKWAVSWLTWVNNNKHKIIARKAKVTASEQSVSKPQTSAQPSAYQAKQDNVNRWKSYGQQAANQFDESRIIDVVPDSPKSFLIEGVGHA